MHDINLILKAYWGHTQFRPLQEQIIRAVLDGQDAVALLPTGGGKSVCFQVPAIAMEGICLVISPLISLMKDQVDRLAKMNIEAYALHSGLQAYEMGQIFEACLDGDRKVKFLYLSPERLEDSITMERISMMRINLIAVDEAHCISQWGHDFRPSYQRIHLLRQVVPKAPIMALTATATKSTLVDIGTHLKLKRGYQTFTTSFARPNLSISIFTPPNRDGKLLQILKNVQGTAIVYVRSRTATQQIALMLHQNGIAAEHYHAGMQMQERMRRQEQWEQGKLRVMVATNAFGMGIDKSDVRTVIHVGMPEGPESYFQEIGRAGRDGKKSYAVMLLQTSDAAQLLRNVEQSYPPAEVIRKVYDSMANHLQIPVGSGMLTTHPFELDRFADHFKLNLRHALESLKRLEQMGYVSMTDAVKMPARVQVLLGTMDLYQFQIQHPHNDPLIKMLMRVLGGRVFAEPLAVREENLAYHLRVPLQNIVSQLKFLTRQGVIYYVEATQKPQLTLLTDRYLAADLPIKAHKLEEFKQASLKRAQAIIDIAQKTAGCRMARLVAWFGQVLPAPCSVCDNCLNAKKAGPVSIPRETIIALLSGSSTHVNQIVEELNGYPKEAVLQTVRQLVDAKVLETDMNGVISSVANREAVK